MAKFGLIGGSYTSQSPNADFEQNINWYYEQMEAQAKNPAVLYPTPGTKSFFAAGDSPNRGGITAQDPTSGVDRTFTVAGSTFYEVSATGVPTNYGSVINDNSLISICYGPTQVFFSSANVPYVFDLTTNVLTRLPDADFDSSKISFVGYCEGFFIALRANSNEWQVSGLFDATSWDLLDITAISTFSGNAISMKVDHNQVWFWGARQSIVYYLSGNVFPFDVVESSPIEQGIFAAKSAVSLDNSVFWIGGDDRGRGIGWRANGYTPSRITNYAEEYLWSTFSTISDAEAYSYQDQGHSFWVIYFPTANRTRVYDAATGLWHERAYWNTQSGTFSAHHSRWHTFNFNKHLVGSPFSGELNEMSINFYDDLGNIIRRVRRSAPISNEQQWIFHHQVQIDCETGLGPNPALQGPIDPSTEPKSFILADSSNVLWSVTIDDTGLLHTTVVGSGIPSTIILRDGFVGSQAWQLGVTTGGLLTTTLVALSPSEPYSFAMSTTPSSLPWKLYVSMGQLVTSPRIPDGRDPQINLRWSDDGHTWSNTHTANCGQQGKYSARAMFYRLGRSRMRTYEISTTDPIPWRIVGGYLIATGGVPARSN